APPLRPPLSAFLPYTPLFRSCSGLTPEAIAKAMASGRATTPTITPAAILPAQCLGAHNPALQASRAANIVFRPIDPQAEPGIRAVSAARMPGGMIITL